MRKPVALLIFVCMLTACGGGGGSNGSPAGVMPGPNSPGSNNYTISPSNTAGGAGAITITEHSLGSTPSAGGIAIANDGSVWTESNGGSSNASLVRWFNGAVTSYQIPASETYYPDHPWTASSILTASGSNVYGVFLEPQDLAASYIQYVFSAPSSGGTPTVIDNGHTRGDTSVYGNIVDLTKTKDGNVWDAQNYNWNGGVSGTGWLAQVTGGSALYELPFDNNDPFDWDVPTSFTQGPDGNFWVAAQNVQEAIAENVNYNLILVYSTSGTLLHTYNINARANGIVKGPDGALWFSMQNGKIGRITTGGAITYYSSSTTTSLGGITVGSDGALWFLEPQDNKLGRITTSGTATDYALPTSNSQPLGIAGPANGCQPYTLWFAEAGSGKIATVSYH